MELHIGTSGFAYRAWIGPFYPAGTPERAMLTWYATRFDTVEINSTFYRFPTAARLAAWAAQVPEQFRFAMKVPQRITHIRRLRGVERDLEILIATATTLGSRLGPLLFQLPPRMPRDPEALKRVTALLPPALRAAFEFRDPSWLVEEIHGLLAEKGCALCFNDATMPAPRPTTDWGYVRLRRERYDDSDLRESAAALITQPWRQAYIFVKHESPDAPLLAERLARAAAELQGKTDFSGRGEA